MRYIIFGVLLFFACSASGQIGDIKFEDYTYSDDIKSVKLSLGGYPISLPILVLNSDTYLNLSFDDLSHSDSDMIYEIIHCDKDWNPSDILETEYVIGFNGERIEDLDYSSTSYSNYINYNLTLPNDDLGWSISGNYILAVYDEDTKDPILTRRFIVVEGNMDIIWRMQKPINVENINYAHAMDFYLKDIDNIIQRPMNDIFATVIQNGIWQTRINNLQPKFKNGERISFNAYDRVSFPALKEFRNFDIRSIRFRKFGVHSIDIHKEGTDILLDLGINRSGRNFFSDVDADGQFIIENDDTQNTIYSEYVNVIFTLESNYEYEEDVYVVGAFTDFQPYDEFKMSYDEHRKLYTLETSLKQGYYDFMYGVFRDDGLDLETFEGSWYETENLYSIIMYYRPMRSRYDRVLCSTTFHASAESDFSIDPENKR